MFNDSDSFYYSPTGDLTNSVQRRHENKSEEGASSVNTDDRFFWNKHMLQDLINSNVSTVLGFVIIPGYLRGLVQAWYSGSVFEIIFETSQTEP